MTDATGICVTWCLLPRGHLKTNEPFCYLLRSKFFAVSTHTSALAFCIICTNIRATFLLSRIPYMIPPTAVICNLCDERGRDHSAPRNTMTTEPACVCFLVVLSNDFLVFGLQKHDASVFLVFRDLNESACCERREKGRPTMYT